MLRQASLTLSIRASRQGLFDLTDSVRDFVRDSSIREGLLTLFCRHTSASLLIQENAAPAARRDLEAYFEGIAPEGAGYEHDEEGPDDMPAHLRSRADGDAALDPGGGGSWSSALGRGFSCSSIAATRRNAASRST